MKNGSTDAELSHVDKQGTGMRDRKAEDNRNTAVFAGALKKVII
jgi:hypothetical protein